MSNPLQKPRADKFAPLFALAALAAVGGLSVALLNTTPGEGLFASAHAAEGLAIPAPTAPIVEAKGLQSAVFAGGCFWGVEGVFEHVKGVSTVVSGYAGGTLGDADYQKVSGGSTGHAEAVRIKYDPAKISYNQLLHIYFSVTHDPTQLNRQGPDHGRQYRSAIFPANAVQRKAASAYIAQLGKAKAWKKPIVTTVESGTFYMAEAYHQDFIANNPDNGYIRTWDLPKIAALKRLFPKIYR